MNIASSGGTAAPRLVLAGLIALLVGACAAPDSNPGSPYQAGTRTQSVAQTTPARTFPVATATTDDPVKAVGDVLEQRMLIMIGSAPYGIFAPY